MKTPASFILPAMKVITASNIVTVEVLVSVFPTLKALHAEHKHISGMPADFDIIAFWAKNTGIKYKWLGSINLCFPHLDVLTISHECQHAALTLGRLMRLDIEKPAAEEIIVEATEHMARNVLKFAREVRAKERHKNK